MRPEKKRIGDGLRRAALYARVSTEEQAQHGVSLDAQEERLLGYAKENRLEIVDLYRDEGISARKRYTRRPEFMRMLADVASDRIDVILFVKLDRWFRNVSDYYEVQAILDRHGVSWIATEEDYDTTTANGRLSLNIRLAIAQDESDRTSERIRFVFQSMVKEGRVISGSVPLGFFIRDRRLCVNESEAELVRDVFRAYVECRSLGATAKEIEALYGKRLSAQVLGHMIANTRYVGVAYGVTDYCPKIVEDALFQKANEILSSRSQRRAAAPTDRAYLFRGILRCGLCGKHLTAYRCEGRSKGGGCFIYYRCPEHLSNTCDMKKQWNEEKVEKLLLGQIEEEMNREGWIAKSLPPDTSQCALQSEKILQKIDRLKELYLENLLPRELYEKDYAKLTERLKECRRGESTPSLLEHEALDFLSLYQSLSSEQKKAFWSHALREIRTFPDGMLRVSFEKTI